MLVCLARQPDTVLSREEILETVWPGIFVQEEVLTRCIAALRRVFSDNPKNPRVIETVARRGYRPIGRVTELRESPLRHRILQKIAEGSVGEIFLARNMELRRSVAIEFLPDTAGAISVGRERLLHAARAAAALDHPFICRIYGTGEIAGKTFIAMEYVEGETLGQRTPKLAGDIRQAIGLAAEAAEALEVAHAQGIVHGDLKPSNIIVTAHGHVKIMDFGVTRRLAAVDDSSDFGAPLAAEHDARDALSYTPPGQPRREETGPATDIIALGSILCETVTGRHPFRKAAPVETMANVFVDEPLQALQPLGHLPAPLDGLIRGMLAGDPSGRYGSTQKVHAELKSLVASLGASAPGARMAGIPALPPADMHPAVVHGWRVRRVAWVPAAVTAAAFITALVVRNRTARDPPAKVRLQAVIPVVSGERLVGRRHPEETRLGLEHPSRTAMTLSPDGKRLTFDRGEIGRSSNISWIPAGRQEAPERRTDGEGVQVPGYSSPDMQYLAYTVFLPHAQDEDIWILRTADRKCKPLARTPFQESCPEFSPDGGYLAYARSKWGRRHVYVEPFPLAGKENVRISSDGGGWEPAWSKDGRELFYRDSAGNIYAVGIRTGRGLEAGVPRRHFDGESRYVPEG